TKLGLPDQLTPDQLQAQFATAGANVSQVADALSKVLTPNDFLTDIGALPNPLQLLQPTALAGYACIGQTTGDAVRPHLVELRFAQLYAPAGLLLLAVILSFGAFLAWRHQPEKPAADVIDVREEVDAREREPAGV